jgi:hypothetical protein
VRVIISLLFAMSAAAFDAGTILDAKLSAGASGGFPCLIRGTITVRLGPTGFYIQDESSGVRVVSEPDDSPPGRLVEVEGWMYLADSGEFQLQGKKISPVANGSPPEPQRITLHAAHAGGSQGKLVSVRGSVLNVEFGEEWDTISIRSGRASLRVFYPANRHGLSAFERIYPGMEVAVTGVSVPQTAAPEGDGYQVRLRSAADLKVRKTQAAHRPLPFEFAGGVASLFLLGAAAWVWSGRRRAPSASQVQYQPGGKDGAFRVERHAQGGAEPDHSP